jgi:hypothetical protein
LKVLLPAVWDVVASGVGRCTVVEIVGFLLYLVRGFVIGVEARYVFAYDLK